MKKLLLLFFVMLFGFLVNAQTDCSGYRKGYFMYTDSLGNAIIVQRRKKYQYEYNRKIKVRTQFSIKWNSNCEYAITQTLTNSKSLRQNKNSVSVTVISKPDGDNGYYYTCNCKGDDMNRKENFMKKITKQEFYKLY
jgi:hypothetical protein